MTKRFVVPFATTGDKTVTPDATDPAGAISYSQGWGAQYQLPDTDPAYRPVGRQEMNGVLFDVTGAIAELQLQGIPSWVAPGGLVPPYPIYAVVRNANKIWLSVITNNSSTPALPNWRDISNIASSEDLNGALPYRGVQSFTTSGVTSWVVPAGVTKVYAKVIAGGGGGGKRSGAASASAAGGGGGGGVTEGMISVTPGASISVTVGAGGAGATVLNTAGANGGASSFGVSLSATGGNGGGVTGGGAGGVGTGGTLNTSLGPGTAGINFSNSATTDSGITGGGGGPGGAGITFSSGSGSINGNVALGAGGGGGGAVFGGNGGGGFNGTVELKW